MVLEAIAVKEKPVKKETCAHYWIIETAQGPKSMGKCRRCGKVREFDNYISIEAWVDDVFKMPSPPKLGDFDFEKRLARCLV